MGLLPIGQLLTFPQRHDFHMQDGEEQQARDEIFMGELGKEAPGVKFPARWFDRSFPVLKHECKLTYSRICPEVQPWLYGYDAKKETDAALKQSALGQ